MDSNVETLIDIIVKLDKTPLIGLIAEGTKLHSKLKEERLKRNLKLLIENTQNSLGVMGNKVFERLNDDARREIDRLILVLDEIDEESKVFILSKLLVAFLNAEINQLELSMYVETVRRSFYDDLEYFVINADKKEFEDIVTTDDSIEYVNAPFPKDSMIALRLSSFSLVVPEHSMRYADLGLLAYYKVTEYGSKLYQVISSK